MFTFTFTSTSGNSKTGPIPTTRTDRSSCPTTCPFYDTGCYAKYGPESKHWLRREDNKISWQEFLSKIKKIARNQLWRHNTAGDLPHNEGNIIADMIRDLIKANRNKKGFTYTHHNLNENNISIIKESNNNGFTINASTESVEQADYVMSVHGIPAVAVVNSKESRRFYTTESGRKVIVCPATIHEDVNCSACGICANSNRESIVAFPAHGTAKKKVDKIIA
jgi:hypothetical protein